VRRSYAQRRKSSPEALTQTTDLPIYDGLCSGSSNQVFENWVVVKSDRSMSVSADVSLFGEADSLSL